MKNKLFFQIASLPDREKLVVELWLNEIQIAEINQEEKELKIILFPLGKALDFSLSEFITILRDAKNTLTQDAKAD